MRVAGKDWLNKSASILSPLCLLCYPSPVLFSPLPSFSVSRWGLGLTQCHYLDVSSWQAMYAQSWVSLSHKYNRYVFIYWTLPSGYYSETNPMPFRRRNKLGWNSGLCPREHSALEPTHGQKHFYFNQITNIKVSGFKSSRLLASSM